MKIVYNLLYIYLILKPFYIFKSGSMQPADFFLVFALLVLLLIKNKREEIFKVVNINKKFLIFIIITIVINGIYFIMYHNTKFILSSLYFIFNFFAIILFTLLFKNDKATQTIKKIFKANLLIQLFIYILKLGKYYGFTRYMGTFNDPNQFGYFVLINYMFIYLISDKYKNNKGDIFFLFIAIFLIFKSASTGMFIGFFLFLVLQLISIIKNIHEVLNKNKLKIFFCLAFGIPIIVTLLLINTNNNIISIDNSLILKRVVEKINKIDSDNNTNANTPSLIQERGYDRFIYYPQYIIYGSGEGEYNRFDLTYHQDEIHATFPSILFYYGIIPFLILISWVWDKIKKSNYKSWIVLLSIFLESFTLLNQRQVLFWILIIFVSTINSTEGEMKNEN